MTSQEILIDQANISVSENNDQFKDHYDDDDEKLRMKYRMHEMRAYTPQHPGRHCWHCAAKHNSPSLNFIEAGTGAHGGRGLAHGCWKHMQTSRHLVCIFQQTYHHLPNGTNVLAPAWFRGPKVWRKDDKTGVFRPRRMMDDMLDKKKADRRERLARGLEVDEEEEAESGDEEIEGMENGSNE